MSKEILTFLNIKVEKYKFFHNQPPIFKPCIYC